MKVILLQDVDKVGSRGTVVEVSDGYARNYLIPRKYARPGTPENLKMYEHQQKFEARKEARYEAELEKMAGKIDGTKVEVTARAGEDGKLYGSVTNADVAEALNAALKLTIDKRRVLLDQHIKQLGQYDVEVRLSGNKTVTIKLTVAQDPEEAARRKEIAARAEAEELKKKAGEEVKAEEPAEAPEAEAAAE